MLLAITISLISGLITGFFIDTSILHYLINPLLITLLLPIMVVIEYKKALSRQNLRLQVITQTYNFTIIPLFVYLFTRLFFINQPDISFGFILYMLLPTAGISIFWTRRCGGNTLNSIKTMLFGLLIGAIATPLYLHLILGDALNFDSLQIVKTNLAFLLTPLIAGYLIQKVILKKVSPERFMELKPRIMLVSNVSIVMMVFIGISMKAKTLLSSPNLIVQILLPVICFYALQYLLSHLLGGLFLEPHDRVSFVYSTTLKNISLALGISISLLQENASGVIVLISLTYIIQQLSAPLYARIIKPNKNIQVAT